MYIFITDTDINEHIHMIRPHILYIHGQEKDCRRHACTPFGRLAIVHTYMHTYVRTYIHAYMGGRRMKGAHALFWVPDHRHKYIHAYIHVYIPSFIHTYLIYIPKYTHTYIYSQMYI